MTNDGWPVAQPRFSSRPSASTITPWPSGKMKRSTCAALRRVLLRLSCNGFYIDKPHITYMTTTVKHTGACQHENSSCSCTFKVLNWRPS